MKVELLAYKGSAVFDHSGLPITTVTPLPWLPSHHSYPGTTMVMVPWLSTYHLPNTGSGALLGGNRSWSETVAAKTLAWNSCGVPSGGAAEVMGDDGDGDRADGAYIHADPIRYTLRRKGPVPTLPPIPTLPYIPRPSWYPQSSIAPHADAVPPIPIPSIPIPCHAGGGQNVFETADSRATGFGGQRAAPLLGTGLDPSPLPPLGTMEGAYAFLFA